MNKLLKFRFKAFALIALLLVSAISAFAQKQIAIIDAGSSGSRLYVYRIANDGKNLELIYPKNSIEEKNSKGRALSGIVNMPDSVEAFVQDMTKKYKPESTTPLYILATAGMRQKERNISASIYGYMKGEFNDYKIKKAMTISGRYEGLYAWMAANYDNNRLGFSISTPEKPLTFTGNPLGIIEIGGASMQIAFAPNTRVDEKDFIRRKGFSVYSRSYLGGGADAIYKQYGECDNPDYSEVVKNLPNVDNVFFLGLSKPIEVALDGVMEKGNFDAYISSLGDDAQSKYHPKSNARYIKWFFGKLGLMNNGTISEKIKKSKADWTKGAALDILINKCEPEPFDYDNPN